MRPSTRENQQINTNSKTKQSITSNKTNTIDQINTKLIIKATLHEYGHATKSMI